MSWKVSGGVLSRECKRFINSLANLHAKRKGEEYGDVVRPRVLRTKLRLSLLKTTLIALRGHSETRRQVTKITVYTLPLSEISFNLVPSSQLTVRFVPTRASALGLCFLLPGPTQEEETQAQRARAPRDNS